MTKEDQGLFAILAVAMLLTPRVPNFFSSETLEVMESRRDELMTLMQSTGFDGSVDDLIQSLFKKDGELH